MDGIFTAGNDLHFFEARQTNIAVAEMKIDLGSGAKPIQGFANIDKNGKSLNVTLVCDLDLYPWPFKDDSVDELCISHCLKHLTDHNRAMEGIHRVLKEGAVAKVTVPHFTGGLRFRTPSTSILATTPSDTTAGTAAISTSNSRNAGHGCSFGNDFLYESSLEPVFDRFPDAYEQSPLRVFPALCVHAIGQVSLKV